jgi:hypothetical protein
MRHAGDMASPGRGLCVAQDAQETLAAEDTLSATEAVLSDRGEAAQNVSLERSHENSHTRPFLSDLIDLCVSFVPVGSCPWCGSWGRMVRVPGTLICLDCLREGKWANPPRSEWAEREAAG